MNKYYQYFKSTEAPRDYVFENVKKILSGRPAKIMEIGCARDVSFTSRTSDGCSSYFWFEYIESFGGQLDIFDISQDALDNCKQLFEGMNLTNVNFICDNALNHIDNDYDLIFLDGSDCPEEMLNQFEKIDRTKSMIFCDDFDSKGSIVSVKYPNYILFYNKNTRHVMALYPRINQF